MEKKISLKAWIDKVGATKIAEALSVEVSTVRHWRSGHCLPQTKQMRAIRKLSNGQVTYENMIDPHFEAKGK